MDCGNSVRRLSLAVLLLIPAMAFAQADCSKQITEIERRIATGDYPEQNVRIARQAEAVLTQMCGFMTEDAKADMMDNLEEILPTKSEDQQQAERHARSKELQAEREAGEREQAARAAARPPLSPVISAGPTAKPVAARIVDRDEDMLHLWIADWDIYQGKSRALYVTMPSRTQIGLPDWRVYVYVAEIGPDGSSVQHVVTSKQALDNRAVALRRGYDEIIFERGPDDGSDESTLERWSISGAKLLSSVPTPRPDWPDGDTWTWQPFRLATADGNVLFVNTRQRRGGTSMVAWFEASPAGAVLGNGSLAQADAELAATGFYRSANGGGGIVLTVTATGNAGLPSTVAGASDGGPIPVPVFSETRALVTSDDAKSGWQSGALSRMLMWGAAAAPAQDASVSERLKQQQELMRQHMELENEYHANRVLETKNVGLEAVPMIAPLARGYGALATVNADRSLEPPIHGPYYLRLGNGGIDEVAYLEPIAEALDVAFEILATSPRGDVYVYGKPAGHEDRSYVVKLSADGEVLAYGRAVPHYDKVVAIEMMIADDAGVWLYGTQTRSGEHQRFWFERLQF